MSLSRRLLESMNLDADKISTIIEAHAETVDSLKAQISTYKEKADKYDSTSAELDKAKSELEGLKASGGDWQKKFEAEHNEFEAFKAEQSAKDLKMQKESAYRTLLKESGISEKRLDSILRLTDLSSIEIEDGKIKDSEKVTENIKNEWSDFITSPSVQIPATQTPPANNPLKKYSHEEIAKMTPDEINANWDSIKESMSN